MYAKKYSVATMIWSIYHIVTSSLDLDNMKHDSWTVTQTLADNNADFLLLLLAARCAW